MSNSNSTNILKINSSGRMEGSYSRTLIDQLVDKLLQGNAQANVAERDVSSGIEFVDENWINANFTPKDDRTAAQKERLAGSDALVHELIAADTLVIAVPIYNFGVPATLKAWVDQIARVGRTFQYTESGPEGLLLNKKAYLVITSGGTKSGSEIDFATGYMQHVLGFIGITDVEIISADQLMIDEEASLTNARKLIASV